MDEVARIVELLETAEELPTSHQAVSLVHEAIRLADETGQIMLAFAARAYMMQLSRSLLLTGELTAAFTWTLAKFDEAPERFARFNPLYEFRWVISLLSNFPNITIEKRDDLLSDMSRRYREAGLTQQAVHEVRVSIAEDFADAEMAREALDALRMNPENEGEMEYSLKQREVTYWLFVGKDEMAVAEAKPFIVDPNYQRFLNPQVCAELLVPLYKLGRMDVAESLEPRVRTRMGRAPEVFYWPFGSLLIYWALTSDKKPERLAEAIRVYEHFQRIISEYSDPLTQTHFYLDSLPIFNRLMRNGQERIAVQLPETIDVSMDVRGCEVVSLRQWILIQCEKLTTQFDVRNRNDYFTRLLEERLSL